MKIWKITRWFSRGWYEYIFASMKGNRYDDERFWRLRVVWCRIQGHPKGVWFFNPSGFEPDMTCKNCGDDLG